MLLKVAFVKGSTHVLNLATSHEPSGHSYSENFAEVWGETIGVGVVVCAWGGGATLPATLQKIRERLNATLYF